MKLIKGLREGTLRLVDKPDLVKAPGVSLIDLRKVMVNQQIKSYQGRKQANALSNSLKLLNKRLSNGKRVSVGHTIFKSGTNAQRIIQNILIAERRRK